MLQQGVEHGPPFAEGRRLDARLQLGQDGLGQLAVVQAAHLADGDDGTESRQDLDGVAQSMQPQDRRRFRGILVQGQRQQAGEGVESFQGRRWDNGIVEGLLDVAVLAEPRLLAADHRLPALGAVHARPSESSDLRRGGFHYPFPCRHRNRGREEGNEKPEEKTLGELLRRARAAARIITTIAGLAYRLCTAFPRLLDGFDSRIPLSSLNPSAGNDLRQRGFRLVG